VNEPAPPLGGGDGVEPLDLLAHGQIDLQGRMPWSSNRTFLVELCLGATSGHAVYKPAAGERPLWDFPAGLYQREVAAYELSEALGWRLVPPTIVRTDAPMGEGSLQWFVDADFEQHYFTLIEDEQWRPQLERICAFDLLANNTDRKSGHCLLDQHGRIWAIDNGLAFHSEFKLRTVIWEFAGTPVPEDIVADIEGLIDRGLPAPMTQYLDAFDRDAVLTRARALVREGRFPVDPSGRRYPWPLI
jgi:uncharacterized repeat protein (TIGR03843 family)